MRVVFHIDLNAFFANAEVSVNSKLKGKPLIIAHDQNRSVVSTASYEARKYGIHSAMPVFQAKKLCKHLVIVEPHFDLYRRLSNAFFELLRDYSKKIEIASIDECYIDMSEYIETKHLHPYDVAKDIQSRVYEKLHLTCSIGISPNKFLSKMASDLKKPSGIVILTRSNIKEILWPMDIKEFYGIGQKTAEKLYQLGFNTIEDIANYDNYTLLHSVFGKHALIYYNKANGRDTSPVDYEESERKSMNHSKTFIENMTDIQSLEGEFKSLCLYLTERAHHNHLLTKNISITLRNARFETITRQRLLEHYTNDFEEIYSQALILFHDFYSYEPIRLIGVSLNNMKTQSEVKTQLSIFHNLNNTQSLVDSLNKNTNYHLMTLNDLLKGENNEN